MEDLEHSDDGPARPRKVNADAMELGDQQRQVERLDAVAGQVAAVEDAGELAGDAGKGRHSATSASVMPWTATAAVGIGTPGLTRR
jgi:hypothetical protein